jgi:hypothetical protein
MGRGEGTAKIDQDEPKTETRLAFVNLDCPDLETGLASASASASASAGAGAGWKGRVSNPAQGMDENFIVDPYYGEDDLVHVNLKSMNELNRVKSFPLR